MYLGYLLTDLLGYRDLDK